MANMLTSVRLWRGRFRKKLVRAANIYLDLILFETIGRLGSELFSVIFHLKPNP
jgi:hypothetical protein